MHCEELIGISHGEKIMNILTLKGTKQYADGATSLDIMQNKMGRILKNNVSFEQLREELYLVKIRRY